MYTEGRLGRGSCKEEAAWKKQRLKGTSCSRWFKLAGEERASRRDEVRHGPGQERPGGPGQGAWVSS